jgi:peptide/nickel transport system ATP-binding protein
MVGDFEGCMFRNRCSYASDACAAAQPPRHSLGAGHSYGCVLPPERCAENYRVALAGEAAQ